MSNTFTKLAPFGKGFHAALFVLVFASSAALQKAYHHDVLMNVINQFELATGHQLLDQEQSSQKVGVLWRRSKESAEWKRLPNIPKEQLEGSCLFHRQELWCVSGHNAAVVSFSPLTKEWKKRPRLLDKAHHTFSSAFSLANGTAILQVGGLDSKNLPTFKTQWLDTPNTNNSAEWAWQSGDKITNAHNQDIGGAVTCTTIPVNGLYFCVFASDLFFYNDTLRFFSFSPDTLHFKSLPIPAETPSHPVLLADPVRGRVLILCHRKRAGPTSTVEGLPSAKIHIYHVEKATWTVSQYTLPEFMVLVDARGFWQDETHGFFAGGQNSFTRYVTDMIYKFTLSPDPLDDSIHIEPWNRLPYALFGVSLVHDPSQGCDQLYVIGGSNAVGPSYSFQAWLWDTTKKKELVAYELQRKTKDDARPAPKL